MIGFIHILTAGKNSKPAARRSSGIPGSRPETALYMQTPQSSLDVFHLQESVSVRVDYLSRYVFGKNALVTLSYLSHCNNDDKTPNIIHSCYTDTKDPHFRHNICLTMHWAATLSTHYRHQSQPQPH